MPKQKEPDSQFKDLDAELESAKASAAEWRSVATEMQKKAVMALGYLEIEDVRAAARELRGLCTLPPR